MLILPPQTAHIFSVLPKLSSTRIFPGVHVIRFVSKSIRLHIHILLRGWPTTLPFGVSLIKTRKGKHVGQEYDRGYDGDDDSGTMPPPRARVRLPRWQCI